MTTSDADQIRAAVSARYGHIAAEFQIELDGGCCAPEAGDNCCGAGETSQAELFTDLYATDTDWLPPEVTGLSLGCGDPVTLAALQPGQTVLDLGSGGGIDCFLAARQVGPTGRVIGVDMTPAMIEKAERNQAQLGLDNVSFRHGLIERLPVADATVDVIISNCVINLSPDKAAVFREAARVLRPGGLLAVSDMVTLGRFGPQARADMAAWSGCITGAEAVPAIVEMMTAAGFRHISIRDKAEPDVELVGAPPHHGPPRLLSARITAVR